MAGLAMIEIKKPIRCKICGKEMTNFTFNKSTQKILFICRNPLHSIEVTEKEYLSLIKHK